MIKNFDEYIQAGFLSKEEKTLILLKWKEILGLEQIPINFFFPSNKPGELTINEKYEALGGCGYDSLRGYYGIVMAPEANKFILIHELGHIYLDKITNCLYKDITDRGCYLPEIFYFKNVVIDSFVNYQLYQISYFKPIYLEEMKYRWLISPKLSFKHILRHYLDIYLCYHFIIGKVYRANLNICNHNLRRTKNMLRAKGDGKYKKPIWEKLNRLDIHLNKFDKIKNTRDYNQIRYFIMKGLKILDLWPQEELSRINKSLR